MNAKAIAAALLLPFVSALACATTVHMTGQWVDKTQFQPGKYSSVFVAVMSQNPQVKRVFEDNLAAEATSRGIKAVKSGDFFKDAGTKEAVLARVRELGLETIFTVALKDKKTSTRYVPGSQMYDPDPYYRGYSGYYGRTYGTVYAPGYYTEDQTYFVESNLYDVASEKLLWSVQSEVMNPDEVQAVAGDYTRMLLDALGKEGLLRPKK